MGQPVEADACESIVAYPMGKGSGSVTTFSNADEFITVDQHTEILESGTPVRVQLLGKELDAADLVIIGSQCVGLDAIVGRTRPADVARRMQAGNSGRRLRY